MSTSELIERIKALPPRELAAVEAYVRALPSAAGTAPTEAEAAEDDPLVAKILARREHLRATIGTLDNHKDIRDMRENGSRWVKCVLDCNLSSAPRRLRASARRCSFAITSESQ